MIQQHRERRCFLSLRSELCDREGGRLKGASVAEAWRAGAGLWKPKMIDTNLTLWYSQTELTVCALPLFSLQRFEGSCIREALADRGASRWTESRAAVCGKQPGLLHPGYHSTPFPVPDAARPLFSLSFSL